MMSLGCLTLSISDCLAKSGFFPLREYAFALSMKDGKTPSPIAELAIGCHIVCSTCENASKMVSAEEVYNGHVNRELRIWRG